jgi:hypothetical protein
MNQPTRPFKLHAPDLSPDSPVTAPGELPAEVAGQPASYFWKDMIHVGEYVHPTRKFSLAVDDDRLAKRAQRGRKCSQRAWRFRSIAIIRRQREMLSDM